MLLNSERSHPKCYLRKLTSLVGQVAIFKEFVRVLRVLCPRVILFVAVTLFYRVIPYEIAKHRNHPHQDALHVAGWVSLFTLHVLWPFLWIWATLFREDRGWRFGDGVSGKSALTEGLAGVQSQLTARRAWRRHSG